MTAFEKWALAIAVISAVTSIVGAVISTRAARSAEAQAELAKAQLRQLARDQEANARADLRAVFRRQGKRENFVLRNVGRAPAYYIRIAASDPSDELPMLGVEEMFPVGELLPGDHVTLISTINLQTRIPMPMTFIWNDDAGDNQRREIKVNFDVDV